MHKRSCFWNWKPLRSQRVNDFQKLLKSTEKLFLSYIFIILSQIKVENVIFSQIWNSSTAY